MCNKGDPAHRDKGHGPWRRETQSTELKKDVGLGRAERPSKKGAYKTKRRRKFKEKKDGKRSPMIERSKNKNKNLRKGPDY